MRAAVAERPDGPDGLVCGRCRGRSRAPGWALVRVEAFGLNRSESMTLRGWSGAAVRFPRILGIECVGVVASVRRDRRSSPARSWRRSWAAWAATSTAATRSTRCCPSASSSRWTRSFPGRCSARCPRRSSRPPDRSRRSLSPRARRCSSAVAPPRSGSRASSSRAWRVSAPWPRRGARRRCRPCSPAESPGWWPRARASPSGRTPRYPRVDGVVDLIGGRAVLDSLGLVRRGGTVCTSGMLAGEWVIDDFEPVGSIRRRAS